MRFGPADGGQVTPLAKLLRVPANYGLSEKAFPAVIKQTTKPSGERLALTTVQEPLWIEQLYLPDKPIANTGILVTLTGQLDASTFAEAVRIVVSETDTLRIRFRMEGDTACQEIVELSNYLIQQIDLSSVADPRAAADQWIEKHLWQTIVWDSFPLFQFALLKLDSHRHLWLLKFNHLLIDGSGRTLLIKRLSEIYEALLERRPPSSPGGATLAQILDVGQKYLTSDARASDLAYFREKFGHAPVSFITTDLRQSAKATTGRSHRVLREISKQDFERLKFVAQTAGCSISRFLLTLVFISLHRLYRMDDVAVGFALHNRTTPAFKETIGLFTQNLPVRLSLSAEMPLSTLIKQLIAEVDEARPHGRFPLTELSGLLNSARRGRNLYDVLFNYNPPAPRYCFGNATTDAKVLSHGFFLPLNIACTHTTLESSIRLTVDYDAGLVSEEDASRLIRCLHVLCTTVGSDDLDKPIDHLQIVDQQEQAFLLAELNCTAFDVPRGTTLPILLRKQVDRTPDATAVVCGNEEISFADLYARAQVIAGELTELSATTGSVVGVALSRGIGLIVSLIAIHEVGAAYLPLDPAYPAERLAYLIDDSNTSVVLVDEVTATILPQLNAKIVRFDKLGTISKPHKARQQASFDDLAYILYTSGSTGLPKGVGVEHRNVVNLICCLRTLIQGEDLRGVLFSTSLNFDISVYEIFLPLIFGGKMIIVDNLLSLPMTKARDEVRLINTGPSLMAALLRLGWTPGNVHTINLAGEVLPLRLSDDLFQANPDLNLFNFYGPTETTVYSTYSRVSNSDRRSPAIGKPLWNTQVYVLGPQGGLLPQGATGELYIGGAGVSRGYLDRPDLTRERFIPNPYGTGTLYRTGDLVRWRTDNELEYLRRDDGQIKIHGQRVELGEIEKQMETLPGIASAVILALPNDSGGQVLHAYAISKATQPYDYSQLISALARCLPHHMLPSSLTWLGRFPMLPNGKLNRRALPVPQSTSGSTSFEAPATETERELAAIWKEVLQLDRVGIGDNFYDLGGASLQGFMIFARIAERLRISLPAATMLQAPTIFLQSQLLDQSSSRKHDDDDIVVQFRSGGSQQPLFFVHDGWGGIMFVRELAGLLETDHPIYGIRPPALDGKNAIPQTIEAVAAEYIEAIRQKQPRGPYMLAGYSFGGFAAFEMARQLMASGENVRYLGIIDASKPSGPVLVRGLRSVGKHTIDVVLQKAAHFGLHYVRSIGEMITARKNSLRLSRGLPLPSSAVHGHYRFIFGRAVKRYRTRPYPGKIVVFAGSNKEQLHDARWRQVAADVEVREIGGSHSEIISSSYSRILARNIDQTLRDD